MGKVYITNENGAQNELSELEARELLRRGLISKRARYWKAGMAESRPVTELLDDANVDAEEEGAEPRMVERIVAKVRDFFQRFKK